MFRLTGKNTAPYETIADAKQGRAIRSHGQEGILNRIISRVQRPLQGSEGALL